MRGGKATGVNSRSESCRKGGKGGAGAKETTGPNTGGSSRNSTLQLRVKNGETESDATQGPIGKKYVRSGAGKAMVLID